MHLHNKNKNNQHSYTRHLALISNYEHLYSLVTCTLYTHQSRVHCILTSHVYIVYSLVTCTLYTHQSRIYSPLTSIFTSHMYIVYSLVTCTLYIHQSRVHCIFTFHMYYTSFTSKTTIYKHKMSFINRKLILIAWPNFDYNYKYINKLQEYIQQNFILQSLFSIQNKLASFVKLNTFFLYNISLAQTYFISQVWWGTPRGTNETASLSIPNNKIFLVKQPIVHQKSQQCRGGN